MASKHRIGHSNRYFYDGQSAFVTSGTTVAVSVPFTKITGYSLAYVGTNAAADGPLSVNATPNADGTIDVTSNTVNVTRPAGTTSGAKFMYVFFGY